MPLLQPRGKRGGVAGLRVGDGNAYVSRLRRRLYRHDQLYVFGVLAKPRSCRADLSEPVDVFSEWIDHCEAEERNANRGDEGDEGDEEDEEDQRNVRQRVE